MALVQRYADWYEKRLIRKHNALKQQDAFSWGLAELGLDSKTNDPARALSEYVDRALADSDAFYALPDHIPYSVSDSELTFPSSIDVDSEPSQTVRARVYSGARTDYGLVVVPHWNASGAAYDALSWVLSRLFDIPIARISLPGHDERAVTPGAIASEVCSANIGRTIRGVRQCAVDIKAVARWLRDEKGIASVGLVGASLGSCVGTLAMAHDPLIESGCFIHSCASYGEAVWTGSATEHVRRELEKHVPLRDVSHYWDIISPGPAVSKLASRRTSTTIISARNDSVFIPELTARLRLIYRRAGVPLEHVVLPCGHYTIGHFPFGIAALEAVIHHIREWTGILPLVRTSRAMHGLWPVLGVQRQ